MDVLVPFCGSARTSIHNQVFLEGVKAAIIAPIQAWSRGACKGETYYALDSGWTDEQKSVALHAMARVYAGWGFSQAFYRQKLYETALGYRDLDDFMDVFWGGWALSKDPENLLTMLYTWQAGDCADQEPYNGDFEVAMKAIKARTLVLPSQTDLYFP